jgi:hypothetical protein
VRLLEISKEAWVNYFCCDSCQHTWHVRKTAEERGLPAGQIKRIGRVTSEQRYVIIEVQADWKVADPLPGPSPEDQWFDRLADFEAALKGPWDRNPINRRASGAEPIASPPPPAKVERK